MSTTQEKPQAGEESAETRLLSALESQIAQAHDHQRRLMREVEILQAKNDTVGEYRCKLMDLRDKLIADNGPISATGSGRTAP